VALADDPGATEPIDVSVGRDIEVTPEIEADLGGELDLEPAVVRHRLADVLTVAPDQPDDAPSPAPGTAPSQRDDVLRAALSDDVQLPSSLIRGAQLWRVTEVEQTSSGAARVSLGRRDTHELELAMPYQYAATLRLGDAVMGADVLWRKKGVFGWGRVDVEFVPELEQPPPIPIWIPLVRLHRPKRAGCQASYSVGRETSNDVQMTVSVLGSGGGGGVKTTLSVKRVYTATSKCVETVMPAKLRIEVGRTLINGTEVASGVRTEVVDAEPNALTTRPVPAGDDACQRAASGLHDLPMRDYDYSKAPRGDSASDEIVIKKEVRGKMSVGLEAGGSIPIKLSLDYQRTTSEDVGITTVFATGARYVAYAPTPAEGSSALEQQIEICWTTKR
jgi:hypothetical protein